MCCLLYYPFILSFAYILCSACRAQDVSRRAQKGFYKFANKERNHPQKLVPTIYLLVYLRSRSKCKFISAANEESTTRSKRTTGCNYFAPKGIYIILCLLLPLDQQQVNCGYQVLCIASGCTVFIGDPCTLRTGARFYCFARSSYAQDKEIVATAYGSQVNLRTQVHLANGCVPNSCIKGIRNMVHVLHIFVYKFVR